MEVLAWLIAVAVVVVGTVVFFSLLSLFRTARNYNKVILRALEKGDYPRAEKIALRYVDSYPHDFVLKYYLAQAYEGQKDYAKAIFYYEKAAILVSSETDVQLRAQFYFRIADLYKRRQQYKEALGYYALVLEKEPHHLKALLAAGECCIHLELYRKAYEHLSLYVSLHPGNVKAYYLLAEVAAKLQRYEEALQNYEEIFLNYENVDEVLTTKALFQSAEISFKLQNYQKSETYFRKLLLVNDYYEEAVKNLVKIFVMVGRLDEAIHLTEEFENKVSLHVKADLYFHIGNGYFKKSLYYKAIEVWKKGFQNCPEHTQLREIMNTYADILTHKGMEIYYGNDLNLFEQLVNKGFPYKEVRSIYHDNHYSFLQVQEMMVVMYRAPFAFSEREIGYVENVLKLRFNTGLFFVLYSLYGIEGWDETRVKQQNQIDLVSGKDFVQWLEETYARFKQKA